MTEVLPLILLIGGAALAPLAIPVLPIEKLISYQQTLGLEPQRTENKSYNVLPQHIADQFGWAELIDVVDEQYRKVKTASSEELEIFTSNYGEAGAIEVLGSTRGLPRPISTHNNYFLWGNSGSTGWLAIGGREVSYQKYFSSVEKLAQARPNPYAMPYQSSISVYLVREPKQPIQEIWQLLKNYN